MMDSRTTGGSARSRYAPALEQCRQLVSTFVAAHLGELFENAGTALLDFAERAESDAVQGRFFEAMGQLQRRRPDIEHIFQEEIYAGFLSFGSAPLSSRGFDLEPNTTGGVELSLVEPDEMEESVASENLVSKANANCFPELYAISQRLAVVAGGRKLKDSEIPGGPYHLVQAFRRAMEGLDVEVRVKVILYALLDMFLIRQSREIYDQYNGILKAAGILPNLKPVPIRSETRQGKADDPSTAHRHDAETLPEEGHSTDLGVELFTSIIDLMSALRNPRQPSAGRGGVAGNKPTTTPEQAAAATGHLVAAFSQQQARQAATWARPDSTPGGRLEPAPTAGRAENGEGQSGAPAASAGAGAGSDYPNIQIDAAFLEQVKVALSQEREQVLEQIKREDLSEIDSDLIDLIGMLFEYMLNDPVLPNAAKALLSHLHTPYLKVALIDRRLLVDSRHPARHLFDEMVEAGSLWVDETNPTRGIFPLMQQTVDRVLQEFTDDISLFEELVESFTEGMQEQQRRADTLEHRTQEAARGREKLHLSKQRASRQVQVLLGRHPIPPALAQFLSTTWTDRLVFILLREQDGEDSAPWRHAVILAERLVGLFEPSLSDTDRRQQIAQIPRLRTEVLSEVERMGSYSHTTVDALRALLDNPGAWGAVALPSPTVALGRVAKGGAGLGTMPTSLPQPDTGLESALSDTQQEMIERLRKMRYGTWFEFATGDGDAPRRIKLSWMSPLTSTCMFVDRAGMQAEIKTLDELADELLSGRAKVIPRPKHPFIDRALVSIWKMLQGDGEPVRIS